MKALRPLVALSQNEVGRIVQHVRNRKGRKVGKDELPDSLSTEINYVRTDFSF